MRTVKYFSRIMILFIFSIGLYSCISPIPVDVVMINDGLFFVLEEEHEISSLRVIATIDKNKFGTGKYIKPLWALGHDLTTDVKSRKYPRLKKIMYGQKYEEFLIVEGPMQLQKNVEYTVEIAMGDKFAREVFIITDDNKVLMPQRKAKGTKTE